MIIKKFKELCTVTDHMWFTCVIKFQWKWRKFKMLHCCKFQHNTYIHIWSVINSVGKSAFRITIWVKYPHVQKYTCKKIIINPYPCQSQLAIQFHTSNIDISIRSKKCFREFDASKSLVEFCRFLFNQMQPKTMTLIGLYLS